MTIEDAFCEARSNMDLIREFNRLSGHALRSPGKTGGLNGMIDDATGRTEKGERDFAEFFLEFIWGPVVSAHVLGEHPK